MISSLAMWALTVGIAALLGVGLYLLAYHRGYVAGLGDSIDRIPVDPPWEPPSSTEFMSELFEDQREDEPPQRYRREA
jgi:hypothetical protein